MRHLYLTILLFLSSLTVTAQNAGYWQQQVSYKIEVELNDQLHSLSGYARIEYINNSPDTLKFIWFHLWPNAYKNDRTALTEQLLENGSTKFYFAKDEARGYINKLDFTVNKKTAAQVDHPQHQDIIKLILPEPLPPGAGCQIETPFHVKLPEVFSRSGHDKQSYQITQWYPKAAVYDRKGWHPMPYLDQGEYYNDFGNYWVRITVPGNYVVASTGELQNKAEQTRNVYSKSNSAKTEHPASSSQTKTLEFRQNNVVDFAWFADKRFLISQDTLRLNSGRIVDINAYYLPHNKEVWNNAVSFIKSSVLSKSRLVGEYPFNVVSVVDDDNRFGGGMEYPTITVLSGGENERMLDFLINHEVGHNWFQGILASHERRHSWMDEGMNTYYDNRYSREKYGAQMLEGLLPNNAFIKKRAPEDITQNVLASLEQWRKDQPIETPIDSLTSINSNIISYTKTGNWMQMLEQKLGRELFDKCMQEYFIRWRFKHPYPEDFKQVMEEISGQDLSAEFALLQKTGTLPKPAAKKQFKLMSLGSLKETDKNSYLFWSPIAGFNFYDKLMPGLALHNYTLPIPKLQLAGAAMYGIKSKSINGIGRINYSMFPGKRASRIDIGISGASFNGDSFTDSTGTINYQRFTKLVPTLRFTFANKNARSTIHKFLQWKTYLIRETGLAFFRDPVTGSETISYPVFSRSLNQMQFTIENNRALYPFRANFVAEQGKEFVRLSFTADYFFNYSTGGGLNLRLFAGKFNYIGSKTFARQFATDPYHLNMTGPKGYEDYTYSNYFIGRNEFEGVSNQQIMIRDGGFKVRTDLLSDKVGKTDDWLASINLTTTVPKSINPLEVLPIKLPLRLFADIGTYAEAWDKNGSGSRFLYDAGFQLSLLRNTVNIYFPVLYSKVYRDYFRSTIPEKRFVKNIAFSIDLQNIRLRQWIPQLPF